MYLRVGKPKGTPSKNYRRVVLQGADDCDLPRDYVAHLESFAKRKDGNIRRLQERVWRFIQK